MAKKVITNWTYEGVEVNSIEELPKGAIAFIYKITDITNGRYYIGRKTLLSIKKNGRGKKNEIKESTWKNYVGSNLELKQAIKSGIQYKKEILRVCFTKAEITLNETKEILCSGALEDPKSYNGWIKATIFKKNII